MLLASLLAIAPAVAAAPKRVMSLNVCTDQLAMMLAAPGQLISVSFLARDPDLSYLRDEAAGYPLNHGLAEEVFLAHPDVVVTGTFSQHNTTELLTRLGFDVEAFPFSQTLDTIPDEIRRMGAILGRSEKAEQVADKFETERKRIEASVCGPSPTALAYDQNGVALGKGTLADSVMRAAGLRNIAAEFGYSGMTPLPLELIVKAKPDIVILRQPLADAPSLADRVALHPALRDLPESRTGAFVPRASWSCGGPFVIEAVKALRALREEVAPCDAGNADDGGVEK